jgi:hypothetical protein
MTQRPLPALCVCGLGHSPREELPGNVNTPAAWTPDRRLSKKAMLSAVEELHMEGACNNQQQRTAADVNQNMRPRAAGDSQGSNRAGQGGRAADA